MTLTIDQRRRCALLDEQEIQLTPQEYRVLHCLGQQRGAVVDKAALLAAMWANGETAPEPAPAHANPMAVDLVIFRLRKKLADNPHAPTYLETRRGFGYALHNAQLGFAHKGERVEQGLAAALPTLLQRPISSPFSATLLDRIENWSLLTRREWDIFILLGQEDAAQLTNQALAHRLVMTENTLKKHLQNIYRKLQVSNRAGAAILSARVQYQLYTEQRLVQEQHLPKGALPMSSTQQQLANETIVRKYYQTLAARDTTIIAPYLADDVVRIGIIFPDEPPKITRGKEQLLARIQRVIDDNGETEVSNLHAAGDKVTCFVRIATDMGRREGIAPLEEEVEFLLQGEQILSFKVVSTPASAAKIRAVAA